MTPPASDADVRLIAFYLPQFHPIAENDQWWGRGFTEWTNVVRARPRFSGHYQPRLPGDLGFYDLRLPEVREAQAELARDHGIHGFCYYHYWFMGKRLLERPFDEVLVSGKPDFPFCLCWANESWRRNWDGISGEVLMAQEYSDEDDRQHIQWLTKAFRDPRYIRIKGRPLVLIYRTSDLPNARQTANTWRAESKRAGIGDIYLCAVEFHGQPVDPASIEFDASVEFQPRGFASQQVNSRGNADVCDYAEIVEHSLREPRSKYKRFPCVFPAWDNSPRRQYIRSYIIDKATPQKYEFWLRSTVKRAQSLPYGEQLVFVNAWNEWGEGAYLEPDLRHGRAYLCATRRALTPASQGEATENHAEGDTGLQDEMPSSIVAGLSDAEEIANLRAALDESARMQDALRHELNAWMDLNRSLTTSNSWKAAQFLRRLRRMLSLRSR